MCAHSLLRLSTVGIDALRIRRIRKHLDFLAIDDQLLIQDNVLHQLSEKSLEEALEERGMYVSVVCPSITRSHLMKPYLI